MEGIEKYEITLEKFDATRRITDQFITNFNVFDMVFNKVEAFKQVAIRYNDVKQNNALEGNK